MYYVLLKLYTSVHWTLCLVLTASGGEVAESCTEMPLRFQCSDDKATGGGGPVVVVREAWIYASMRLDPDMSPRCHVQEFNLDYKAGSFLQYINKQ